MAKNEGTLEAASEALAQERAITLFPYQRGPAYAFIVRNMAHGRGRDSSRRPCFSAARWPSPSAPCLPGRASRWQC